jgi:TM2 domain-containing membrane protein YozV
MPTVVCPSCSAALTAPDSAAGKRVKCPKCTSTIEVPGAELPPVLEAEFTDEAPSVSARGGAVHRRFEEPEDALPEAPREGQSNRVAAGVLGIVIGSFGIHKFIVGNTTPGLIMLLVSLLTCGVGALVMHIIGIIEGIKYLMMSDAEFYQTYVVDKKGWF